MVANMIGRAGTPPPTQREAELQAENARLRVGLRAAAALVAKASLPMSPELKAFIDALIVLDEAAREARP